jgi:hypothetical protein
MHKEKRRVTNPASRAHLTPAVQALFQVIILEIKRKWKTYCVVALLSCITMVLFVESGQHFLRKWQEDATGKTISDLGLTGRMENGSKSEKNERRSPLLTGLNIYVNAANQQARKQASLALEKAGATLLKTEGANPSDIVLRLTNTQDGLAVWELEARDISAILENQMMIQIVMDRHARAIREELTKTLPVDAREQRVYLNNTSAIALKKELERKIASTVIYIPLALLTYFIIMFSGSIAGVEWDTRRSQGSLEAWALTPHGPWTLYCGESLARAIWATSIILVLGLILHGYEALPLSVVLGLGVLGFGGICFISMWGMLATMMFHHRYGRLLGRLVLSPAVFTVITLVRLSFITGFASVLAAGSASDIGSRLNANGLAITLLVLGGGLFAASLPLVALVEWRIGARRIGLRKL